MHKRWSWWGAWAVGLIISTGAQASKIQDPLGLLARIDAHFASRSLSDAYRAGDQSAVRPLNWDCFSQCFDFLSLRLCAPFCRKSWEPGQPDIIDQVTEAGASGATTVRGADGTTETQSLETFLADGRSLVRSVLRSLEVIVDLKGDVGLTSLKEVDFEMTNQASAPSFDLRGELIEDGKGGKIFFQIVLAKKAPAVAEILFLNLAATPQNLENQEAVKLFRVRSFSQSR